MGSIARKKTWLVVFVAILSGLAVTLSSLPAGLAGNGTLGSIVHADPKGIKYTGAGACGGNGCHGEPVKDPKPVKDPGHDELTIWQKNDGHARAFEDKIRGKKGLLNKETDKIAKAMNLTKAAESPRCLACHALTGFSNAESKVRIPLDFAKDITEDCIKTEKFKVKDGVSCDACHGPSEKYLPLHDKKDWTANMRKSMDSAKLFDEMGLYNTKDLHFRANLCVSCHLRIDPDMVKAGHPEPTFELDSMSHGKWMHWRPNGDYFGIKAWAMGQFACVREAALQLADRVSKKADNELIVSAYKQLVSHVLVSRHPAKFINAELGAKLDAGLKAVNDDWADPAKVAADLHELGKTADKICEALTEQIGKGGFKATDFLTLMLKDVAAEGEVASKLGFQAALQYSYAMTSLIEGLILKGEAPNPDPDAMKEVFTKNGGTIFKAGDDLAGTVGDKDDFKADAFLAAAKKVMAEKECAGGAALPLPAGGPVK